jgi:hypothetical protein
MPVSSACQYAASVSATYAAAQCCPLDMPFTYRCPDKGRLLQSRGSTMTSDGVYEVAACALCGRLHLINLATGKVVGEAEEQLPTVPE